MISARGGAKIILNLILRFFSIYMHRAPARPLRALCEFGALLLSKNMTSMRFHYNAISSEQFHPTSYCILLTPHFMLHTCMSHSTLHLISNHLISSNLISPHLSSSHLFPSFFIFHLSKTVFISFEH